MVGFDIFPSDDNNIINVTIDGPLGQRTAVTEAALSGITDIFSGYDELDYASISIKDNKATVAVQLVKKKIRQAKKEVDVFAFEKILAAKLAIYEQK